MRIIILSVITLAFTMGMACGGLVPGDILVVYNDCTDPDWSISRRVADYYCAVRGIPESNKCGVICPV